MNTILSHAFPSDPIVGEEDAADLRSNETLRERVVQLANDALAEGPLADSGEQSSWGLGKQWTADELLQTIDRGNYEGGRTGRTSNIFYVPDSQPTLHRNVDSGSNRWH